MAKKRPVIGFMAGSFHSDYPKQVFSALYEKLEDTDVDLKLFMGADLSRFLNEYAIGDGGFSYHFSSMYGYCCYDDLDALLIAYGTISIFQKNMDMGSFLASLPKVPILLLGSRADLPDCYSITIDNYAGMKRCVEHLIKEHGRRHIAFLAGPENSQSSNIRMQAYKDALAESGITVEKRKIAYGNYLERADDAVEALLKQNPDLDAIVSANDDMCTAVYQVARKHGIQIGTELAVTGFDDMDFASHLNPPLTTVRQDYGLIAEEVAGIVREFIATGILRSACVPAKLVRRSSCGCPASKKHKRVNYIGHREDVQDAQVDNIVGALILRELLLKTVSRKAFFERLAKVMHGLGTASSYVYLLEEPVKLQEGEVLTMPDSVRLYMIQDGSSCKGYGEEDALAVKKGTLQKYVSNPKRPTKLVTFVLFYEQSQFGMLAVETTPEKNLLYFTLALQVGSGLRYLWLSLRQEEMRRALEEQNHILDHAARHDELTGLYNRMGIMGHIISFVHAHAMGDTFVAVMADLDHLKQINDTFGHTEGDFAIRKAADILKRVLPEGPVGRSGGDEFMAVFMKESENQIMEITSRLKGECELFNGTSMKPYYIGISIGFCEFGFANTKELKNVYDIADKHLYEAKKSRRKSVLRDIG